MGENKIECLNYMQAISWNTMNTLRTVGSEGRSEKEMKKSTQLHIFVVLSSMVLFGIESGIEYCIVLFIAKYDLLRY